MQINADKCTLAVFTKIVMVNKDKNKIHIKKL